MSTPNDVIATVVARLLLAPSIMVAFALIVKGYAEVGDGFAAGVLVGLAISLRYVAMGPDDTERGMPGLRHAPRVMIGGLLIVLCSCFFPLLRGEPPVSHLPAPGDHVVTVGALEVFTPFALDIGIFLLVVGGITVLMHQFSRPQDDEEVT